MKLGRFEIGLNVESIERSLGFYRTLGFELVNGSALATEPSDPGPLDSQRGRT